MLAVHDLSCNPATTPIVEHQRRIYILANRRVIRVANPPGSRHQLLRTLPIRARLMLELGFTAVMLLALAWWLGVGDERADGPPLVRTARVHDGSVGVPVCASDDGGRQELMAGEGA
jgi:hypothetical protein